MYRSIEDFISDWTYETESTLKCFERLTPASLNYLAYEGGRTLGRIAWHIVCTIPEMGNQAGLEVSGPDKHKGYPKDPAAFSVAYKKTSDSLIHEVSSTWLDSMLEDQIPMYGQNWRKGAVLSILIKHQAHHRGQLTILMRQAGLTVPGVYGPAKEEWAAMGMAADE